jgi:hypothetical protein
VERAADSLTRTDPHPSCGLPYPRWRASAWGLCLAVGFVILGSLIGCSAAVGRLIGQQFVSPVYAFEVPLPGDEWKPVAGEQTVLTLTHPQLAAGITINVTCDRERTTPLSVLTRHLFFGFKDMDILLQERRTLNGMPALQTVARARLDTQDVQVNSYVVERDGCVYDMVYFASPQDYPRGEATFERLVAGFRFLN